MNKSINNFNQNLLDAITAENRNFTGGFYTDGKFYTNNLNHAQAVAYLCDNSIMIDSRLKSYAYCIIENK